MLIKNRTRVTISIWKELPKNGGILFLGTVEQGASFFVEAEEGDCIRIKKESKLNDVRIAKIHIMDTKPSRIYIEDGNGLWLRDETNGSTQQLNSKKISVSEVPRMEKA